MLLTRAIITLLVLAGLGGYHAATLKQASDKAEQQQQEARKYRNYELCKMYFIDSVTIRKYGLEVGREANAHCADRLK